MDDDEIMATVLKVISEGIACYSVIIIKGNEMEVKVTVVNLKIIELKAGGWN